MEQEKIDFFKQAEIDAAQLIYKVTGQLLPQMNIGIELNGKVTIKEIAGIAAYGKEMFFNVIAPTLVEAASKEGKIIFISIVNEIAVKQTKLENGKIPANYKDLPAKDMAMIMFQTETEIDYMMFDILPGRELKREMQTSANFEGSFPNLFETLKKIAYDNK